MHIVCLLVHVLSLISLSTSDPAIDFNYPNVKGKDIYDVPVNLLTPKKNPHDKVETKDEASTSKTDGTWSPYDFSKFESYMNNQFDGGRENNRIKRRSKKRHRSKFRSKAFADSTNSTSEPETRRQSAQSYRDTQQIRSKKKKSKNKEDFETYNPAGKHMDEFVEMPKDLYQAHLRPGVIFRIHMAEAILKMQYRTYAEDKDASIIEADVEYLRLTRKVINDEITKFEDLKWLIGWFNNRSDLIQEHTCNTKYSSVGIPPTKFTHSEEYMKRMCLFDNVYIDHIPYVIGEDSSLMAAVAPPVLHCDAATCTSVPFIDSIMFDDRLARTNVRTVTRCQAGCRAHCKNDADCLKRCSDRCLRP